jgi:hypothetical protein
VPSGWVEASRAYAAHAAVVGGQRRERDEEMEMEMAMGSEGESEGREEEGEGGHHGGWGGRW